MLAQFTSCHSVGLCEFNGVSVAGKRENEAVEERERHHHCSFRSDATCSADLRQAAAFDEQKQKT